MGKSGYVCREVHQIRRQPPRRYLQPQRAADHCGRGARPDYGPIAPPCTSSWLADDLHIVCQACWRSAPEHADHPCPAPSARRVDQLVLHSLRAGKAVATGATSAHIRRTLTGGNGIGLAGVLSGPSPTPPLTAHLSFDASAAAGCAHCPELPTRAVRPKKRRFAPKTTAGRMVCVPLEAQTAAGSDLRWRAALAVVEENGVSARWQTICASKTQVSRSGRCGVCAVTRHPIASTPASRQQYQQLLAQLASPPDQILHLWLLDAYRTLDGTLDHGFYSLLWLAQRWASDCGRRPSSFRYSRRMQQVCGETELSPKGHCAGSCAGHG